MHKPNSIINNATSNPALHLMQQWQYFMDGIDRIITFYKADGSTEIEGLEWNQHLNSLPVPVALSSDIIDKLQLVSNEKSNYQWQRPELLPFINKTPLSLNQLNLFSEADYLVLLVRVTTITSPILSYLFFRNDCSNFGMSDAQSRLETSHKAIIGKMASRFAQMNIKSFLDAKNREDSFRQQTRKILASKQVEADNSSEDLDSWKINWLVTYLSDLGQRDSVNYVISEDAQMKLVKGGLSFESCKYTIDNCISYICNLLEITPGDDVHIEASYLIIQKEVKKEKPLPINGSNSRSSKTMHLLDRLESSALVLNNQGLSITSSEVGANMEKPITAPAISDALRKNRVRILQLFEQYPQKWPTIRQSFKPISNLIAQKSRAISNSG